MNRRNLLSKLTIFTAGAMVSLPLVIQRRFINANRRGFKNLLSASKMKLIPISDKIKEHLTKLNPEGLHSFSDEGYAYNGNLLLTASKNGTLFTEKGWLFVVKNGLNYSHLFLRERQLEQLDQLMYSYVEGMKEQGIKGSATDFLFPHKINKNTKEQFSYSTKKGNEISLKKRNKNSKANFYIS